MLSILVTIYVFIASQLPTAFNQAYFPPGIGNGNGGDCFKDFPYLLRRFSWEQLEFFCQQKRAFDQAIFNETVQPFTENQLVWLKSLSANLNVSKNEVYPHVRKEYRLLTTSERRRFLWAIQGLKRVFIDGVSRFDLLALLHHPALAPGSHVGAAFLPWHRVHLNMFQEAMHEIHPTSAIPYWDSTLDYALPNPEDSIFWSEQLVGNGDGEVNEGPFSNWRYSVTGNETDYISLVRNISQAGSLWTPAMVEFTINRPKYSQLTACVDLTFERSNRQVFEWVGGAMSTIYYAPQDPLFYMHHAYTDYLWEQFRQNKQNAQQRAYDYPPNYEACTQFHYGYSIMEPFGPLRNIDGLNEVLSYYSRYEPVPTCNADSTDCVSQYLFCDVANNRCVSRIKIGGNCSGFDLRDDPCYDGDCIDGKCQKKFWPQPPGFESVGPITNTDTETEAVKQFPFPASDGATKSIFPQGPVNPTKKPPVDVELQGVNRPKSSAAVIQQPQPPNAVNSTIRFA